MIARIWRGRTRESDQNTYFEYLQRTGLKDYASILAIAVSGCCGVFMKVRRSSRSYRCGIHGMRSKPLLVLSMKRRSTIPKTRHFCWNSIRTSRTTRFCSPAEARRISCDNLPGILHQHSRNRSRHQVRHSSRQHGSHSETRQFPFLVWRERTDSADLNPNGT